MTVGEKVRFLRKFRNISQQELSRALGSTFLLFENIVEEYENGTRIPKNDVLMRIAEIMAVSDILLFNSKDKTTAKIMKLFWDDVQLYIGNRKFSENVSSHKFIDNDNKRKFNMFQEYRQLMLDEIISFKDYVDVMCDWKKRSKLS